jgi:hypothetical protein
VELLFRWRSRLATIRTIENLKANRKVTDCVKEIVDSVHNMGFLPFDSQSSFRTLCRFPRPQVMRAPAALQPT